MENLIYNILCFDWDLQRVPSD